MKEEKEKMKFVICVTPESKDDIIFGSVTDYFGNLNFLQIHEGRISKQLVQEEIQMLLSPKIVVCGPASFNSCVSSYCAEINIPREDMTILDS